jgi:hypothetical protein
MPQGLKAGEFGLPSVRAKARTYQPGPTQQAGLVLRQLWLVFQLQGFLLS